MHNIGLLESDPFKNIYLFQKLFRLEKQRPITKFLSNLNPN